MFPIVWTPLRGSPVDIPENARWEQHGIVVAGGYGEGNGTNQFKSPEGLFLDDEENLWIADELNHRIMKWKVNATTGQVVAGGNGRGNELIMVRWPRQNGTSGTTIISHVDCWGLTMDESGFLYVSLSSEHAVRRYGRADSEGTVVAGGNGKGSDLNQLNRPSYVFVDRDRSVYITDLYNDRVMKWEKNAKSGLVVAGGHGSGSSLEQLHTPRGVVVDQSGTLYVADDNNDRIMRWSEGATQGSVVIDGSEQEIDVSSSNIDTDIGAANILGVIPAEKVPMFSTEHSSIVIHK
ncbi:unnamed protein product, partial [Rotaria sp. Silwood1]